MLNIDKVERVYLAYTEVLIILKFIAAVGVFRIFI
jgi:energy-converting hydrogenase Eha subunit E